MDYSKIIGILFGMVVAVDGIGQVGPFGRGKEGTTCRARTTGKKMIGQVGGVGRICRPFGAQKGV